MSDTGHASVEVPPVRPSEGNGTPQELLNGDGRGDSAPAARAGPPTDQCAAESASVPTAACAPRSRTTVVGLSRGDTWFALVVGGVILALMLIHWARLTWRGEPRVEIDRLEARAYEFQLDINRATWVEWMQLEDIGETLARRIVADREANGPFVSIDNLRRVSGIGPKTLDAIRPHLRCPDCPTPNETSP